MSHQIIQSAQTREISKVFRAIDTNKKGYLQLQDMQDAIQSEEVKDLFERITGEKTDKIDFSVF